MTNTILKSALVLATLFATGTTAHAASDTSVCVRNVIAQYNAAKDAARICLDDLEADIQEGIETGLPLSPITIEARTETCQQLEMSRDARQAAIRACN